ncbi:hypothetical protein BOVMAS18_14590 [Streptococcus uberis]
MMNVTDFKSNFIFPKRLKSLRQESGLKQQEIAEKLDVTQGAYQEWESGTREPTLENVVKLAKLFKTTTDFLLGGNR